MAFGAERQGVTKGLYCSWLIREAKLESDTSADQVVQIQEQHYRYQMCTCLKL